MRYIKRAIGSILIAILAIMIAIGSGRNIKTSKEGKEISA